MGTKPRRRPERLAGKLRQIREALGLSQSEMWRRLGVEDLIVFKQISAYEVGQREPTLLILLRYAEAAGVWIDVLVNDDLDLPEKLPAKPKSEGVKRRKGR